MLPLVSTSFTVGQTGLGVELPSPALLGTPLAAPGPAGPWGQSWSPGWPYRGHLDCGLAGGEGSLRLKASTGTRLPLLLPLLGGHAGTTRPRYVLCPGARMPLCPSGGSAQGVPSLCGPPGCPSAVTLLLDLFSHPPASLSGPPLHQAPPPPPPRAGPCVEPHRLVPQLKGLLGGLVVPRGPRWGQSGRAQTLCRRAVGGGVQW